MLSRYGGKPCVELHGEDKILFDLVVGCERRFVSERSSSSMQNSG